MEEADIQALRAAGLDDRKIYYVVEMAALYNLTNRITAGYGMRPDDGFTARIAPQPIALPALRSAISVR